LSNAFKSDALSDQVMTSTPDPGIYLIFEIGPLEGVVSTLQAVFDLRGGVE